MPALRDGVDSVAVDMSVDAVTDVDVIVPLVSDCVFDSDTAVSDPDSILIDTDMGPLTTASAYSVADE